jgi:hypothetical protein
MKELSALISVGEPYCNKKNSISLVSIPALISTLVVKYLHSDFDVQKQ